MKNKLSILILIIAMSLLVVFAAPGSAEDPLVSVSYVEDKLTELKDEMIQLIDQKTVPTEDDATPPTDEPSLNNNPVFEALTFPNGSQLVFGESTEFIVRRGTATLIDPDENNLPDLTSGIDIAAGEEIPLNHHMLCPRRDGRGLVVAEDSADFWILIKGDYIVIK